MSNGSGYTLCSKCNKLKAPDHLFSGNVCRCTSEEPQEQPCECMNWARAERPHGVETNHHYRCKYYDPVGEAKAIIIRLTQSMELWASDEDGIHHDAWEAYKEGLFFTMQTDKFFKAIESESQPMRNLE